MITKELGRTGVLIPEVGIGTWNYHAGPLPLRSGLEAGALFIDTAESYGAEDMVRQAVDGRRDRVFIATKVSPQNFRSQDLRKSVDASLLKLGINTIDLLQLHAPNPSIPIEETMGAMADLVDAGKVRFVGVSNFTVPQFQEAQKVLRKYPIVSNQVRYNLIDRTIEKDLLPYCLDHQVTLIAYCPLARGLSRIRDCDPQGTIDKIAVITGKSPAQIVLNWCLCKERVVVIPKGNSSEHILENCAASDWRLSAEQLGWLDAHIQFRHRNAWDKLVRRYMPSPLERIALQVRNYLPKAVRRRLT